MLRTLYARMTAVGLALSAAFFPRPSFRFKRYPRLSSKSWGNRNDCLPNFFCAVIVAVVVHTRLYRGPRYALRHNGMATRLRYDLLDAGVCARRD